MQTDPTRHQLEALPPPPLPDDLWPRLAARRERERNRRRWLGAAAGLVLAAVALPLLQPAVDEPPHPVAERLATTPQPTADAILAVDRALQAAYARGATDAEVSPLWEIRRHLSASRAVRDADGS